jgi:hypothetical protein
MMRPRTESNREARAHSITATLLPRLYFPHGLVRACHTSTSMRLDIVISVGDNWLQRFVTFAACRLAALGLSTLGAMVRI